MKKLISLVLFCLLLIQVFGQKEKEVTKDGWNFGALPTITFDSDLGFQYGALVNLYDYGDGSRYPNYNHSLYFEVSRFTKGSGINRFYYNSDRLIKGLQTSLDLSYLTDQAYDFYGFNGYDAVLNTNWTDSKDANYVSRMFYKYDRKMFRLKVDLQGKLAGEKLRWSAGLTLLNFNTAPVDIDRLNKGKEGSDLLPKVDGLFQKYQSWGLISADEANGGFVPSVKVGLVYDSRDNKPNPMKGVWEEAVIETSPGFLGGESSFTKLSVIHREYFTLVPKKLSFAYRLAYQTTLGNSKVPFYYQTQMITSVLTGAFSEGIGGGTSIRGINRNRVIGDGYFLGNAEMRWKFVRFRFIKNNFYLGLNAFTDFGRVTKKIDLNLSKVPTAEKAKYFATDAEKFHLSYGAGLRIAMNENFIIKCDYGMAASKQDGDNGIYIGLNYLF